MNQEPHELGTLLLGTHPQDCHLHGFEAVLTEPSGPTCGRTWACKPSESCVCSAFCVALQAWQDLIGLNQPAAKKRRRGEEEPKIGG